MNANRWLGSAVILNLSSLPNLAKWRMWNHLYQDYLDQCPMLKALLGIGHWSRESCCIGRFFHPFMKCQNIFSFFTKVSDGYFHKKKKGETKRGKGKSKLNTYIFKHSFEQLWWKYGRPFRRLTKLISIHIIDLWVRQTSISGIFGLISTKMFLRQKGLDSLSQISS